jgi:hypothetical protein
MYEGNQKRVLESIPEITARLGWRLYLGVALYAVTGLVVTMRWFPNYYWSALAVIGVILLTLMRFWAFSRKPWFWVTMVPLAALQLPLMLTTNQLANRFKGSFIFFLMLFDLFFLDLVVRWISPELRAEGAVADTIKAEKHDRKNQ